MNYFSIGRSTKETFGTFKLLASSFGSICTDLFLVVSILTPDNISTPAIKTTK